MEPVSAIVLSLALGAEAAAGKAVVAEIVKDAYAKVKGIITSRFSSVPLSIIEASPESGTPRAVLEEDLAKLHADRDTELVAAAQRLIELITQHSPQTLGATGITIEDAEAANIRLSKIISSGHGIIIKHTKTTGDIVVDGVEAGVTGAPPKNEQGRMTMPDR